MPTAWLTNAPDHLLRRCLYALYRQAGHLITHVRTEQPINEGLIKEFRSCFHFNSAGEEEALLCLDGRMILTTKFAELSSPFLITTHELPARLLTVLDPYGSNLSPKMVELARETPYQTPFYRVDQANLWGWYGYEDNQSTLADFKGEAVIQLEG